MDIRFVQYAGSAKGRTGHYHILNWGVFDRAAFLVRFGMLLDKTADSLAIKSALT